MIMTANAIREIIINTVASSIEEARQAGFSFNVSVYTLNEIVDIFRSLGIEPSERLINCARVAGAQCCAGDMVRRLYEAMESVGAVDAQLRSLGLSDREICAMRAFMSTCSEAIVVYEDNLVDQMVQVLSSVDWTEEQCARHVRNNVRGLIAHELRHAVQRVDLVDTNRILRALARMEEIGAAAYYASPEGLAEYLGRPEEADAYAFQAEVEAGRCGFEDIRTWCRENVAA